MHALRADIGALEVAIPDGTSDSCWQDYLLLQGGCTRQEQALTCTSLAIVLAGECEKQGWDWEVITNIGSRPSTTINVV